MAKANEGLNPLCTAKGCHTGSGGKAVNMFVAICYGKGVIFCEQYEKCHGDYFANFIRRNFRKLFRASGKMHSRLFVQDNCPIQNCVKRVVKGFFVIRERPFLFPVNCEMANFFLVKRDLVTEP